MTNRRRSATTRSVPAETPERLLELTQEHIRPLIGLIDRLNEAGAEDELRVISKQLTRLSFRVQPLSSDNSPQEPLAKPLALLEGDRPIGPVTPRGNFCPAFSIHALDGAVSPAVTATVPNPLQSSSKS